jgi:lipopolysaccharide transport system ATP-binding protein
MTKIKQENAIICDELSKEFYLVDDNLNWRIVFRDSNKQMESFKALTNICLTVPKGKFLGVLGRNGAGKSTLLRVLGSVYSPTKGIVKTFGEVSGLFEMGGLGNNVLTGYAYADRYLEVYGINKQQRETLLYNICEFSELNTDFNKPLYTYSSGMLARLYFATATELQHEIYLVDELLSVGDEHFQAKCWKRLRERFTNGASGVLVTHDWSAVLKICETAYILEKGRVINFGPSGEMVTRYLNLPKPTKEYAEISVKSEKLKLVSGEDAELDIDVFLKKSVVLALSYSVEVLRVGFGWEIILLNEDYVPIPCKLGHNLVQIKIKKLPLISGEYILNIFLKSLDGGVESTKLDALSWTYGNGIKVYVQGKNTISTTTLPWKIKLKGINHATA